MIKVAFISDTHNQFPKVPECDLVVHCGDLTNRGTEAEVLRMLDWFSELKAQRKVLVPGNHDWFFQLQPSPAEKLCLEMGVDLLVDEEITVGFGFDGSDSLRIWGSPWQPTFMDWAFNLDSPGPIQDKWDLIPRDGQIDILVTHGPSRGVLDLTCPQSGGGDQERGLRGAQAGHQGGAPQGARLRPHPLAERVRDGGRPRRRQGQVQLPGGQRHGVRRELQVPQPRPGGVAVSKAEYVHDVCACGCTKLKVPLGTSLDQLWVRFTPQPGQETLRLQLEMEIEKPMYGWEKR